MKAVLLDHDGRIIAYYDPESIGELAAIPWEPYEDEDDESNYPVGGLG